MTVIKMWSLFLSTIIVGMLPFPCFARTKNWAINWNLEDSNNWDGSSSIECGNNDVILSDKMDYFSFIGSGFAVASLTLPSNGDIIFGEGANLKIGQTSPKTGRKGCKETPQQKRWSHTGQDKWWDPLSWEIPTELEHNATSIPDTHRIPCTTDIAVFPDPEKYLTPVHFSPPLISVSGITIGKKNYTTSSLLDYATAEETSHLFTGYSWPSDNIMLLSEEQTNCNNRDCQCTLNDDIQKTICQQRNKKKCPEIHCENPVSMKGFCCKMCGADVALPKKFRGNSANLVAIVSPLSHVNEFLGIASYVGLMEDNQYHVFLTQRNQVGDYLQAAELLRSTLTEKLDNLEAEAIALVVAGASTWKKAQESKGTTTALVICFLIVFVAGICYYIHKRGLPRFESAANFRFRRMSLTVLRRMSRISLQSEMLSSRRESESSASVNSSFNAQSGLRFSNPIFSKSTASLAAMPIDPEGDETTSGSQNISRITVTHENPMYSAYEHMTPEEREFQEAESSSAPTLAGPPKPPRLPTVEFNVQNPGAMRFSYLGTIEETNSQTLEDEKEVIEKKEISEDTKITIEIPELNTFVEKMSSKNEKQIVIENVECAIKSDFEKLNDNLMAVDDENLEEQEVLNIGFESE